MMKSILNDPKDRNIPEVYEHNIFSLQRQQFEITVPANGHQCHYR